MNERHVFATAVMEEWTLDPSHAAASNTLVMWYVVEKTARNSYFRFIQRFEVIAPKVKGMENEMHCV